MDNDIIFLVKFGEKDHLQQIIDGTIRFSPSHTYVKMEQQLHNKGQGDILEGKMKLKFEKLKMYYPNTNELIFEHNNHTAIVNIENVNNMPIFCLSAGLKKFCTNYQSKNKYSVKFDNNFKNTINTDFKNANYALIILEPNKFLTDITDCFNCTHSLIHYYDYNKQTLQHYMYLTTGSEDIVSTGTMTYENRYRHLLCKDISFSNQYEYRFIKLDELIDNSIFRQFSFTSKYLLISIEELFKGIDINF